MCVCVCVCACVYIYISNIKKRNCYVLLGSFENNIKKNVSS